MYIFLLLICGILCANFPVVGGNYYYYLENRKIYFLTRDTYYKGRVHVDLSTNLSGNERKFCEDFDQGKLKASNAETMMSIAPQSFFSPLQCGDGDPKVPLGPQLKQETVFERMAVMCDASQIPNCTRYALNSKWAKERWSDTNAIKVHINEILSQGMEVRIRDFLSVGGHLRLSNDTIPCFLFRNEMCGDVEGFPQSSQYSSAGEEWYMTQAVNCDAHLISPCLFNALYSNWAKKWPKLLDRKKALFGPMKKAREKRVKEIVKKNKPKPLKIKLF